MPKNAIIDFFLQEQGTIHQLSCLYRPKHDFVVERKHCILNVAYELYFQPKVPISFWGECVGMAAGILNRLPTSVLKDLAPFEKLYGTSPKYQDLRAFGYLCYAATIPQIWTKFSCRASPCVFIHYPSNYK